MQHGFVFKHPGTKLHTRWNAFTVNTASKLGYATQMKCRLVFLAAILHQVSYPHANHRTISGVTFFVLISVNNSQKVVSLSISLIQYSRTSPEIRSEKKCINWLFSTAIYKTGTSFGLLTNSLWIKFHSLLRPMENPSALSIICSTLLEDSQKQMMAFVVEAAKRRRVRFSEWIKKLFSSLHNWEI